MAFTQRITLQEFGKKVKQKYPQYANITDEELANKVIAKYPQYQKAIVAPKAEPIPEKPTGLKRFIPESIRKLGETLTGFFAEKTTAGRVAEETRQKEIETGNKLLSLVKKTTDKKRKEKLLFEASRAYRASGMQIKEIETALDKSTKQVASEILGTVGWAAMFAAPAQAIANPLTRIAWGTVIGAGTGAKTALGKEKTNEEILAETTKGALVGGLTATAFEVVGAGLRLLSRKGGKKIAGQIFTKELQPKTKELATQIEKGWTTTGQKVANAVDDAGNPIYRGGYESMRKQAQEQIVSNSDELKGLLKQYPKARVTMPRKSKLAFIDRLEDIFGALDDTQKRTVAKEWNKIPKKMNLIETLNQKQILDKKIPPTFWIDANPSKSFVGHVKYELRKGLKEAIEDSVSGRMGANIVKTLNNKISLAMDVRKLTALQQAIRRKGGAWFVNQNIISSILDKTIFNPIVQTRIAGGLQRMGQIGQGLTGRNIFINQLTQLLEQ